VVKFSKFANT